MYIIQRVLLYITKFGGDLYIFAGNQQRQFSRS